MKENNTDLQNGKHCLQGDVKRSCVCGNQTEFEVWTELEKEDFDDTNDFSNLITVEYVKCKRCGEIL